MTDEESFDEREDYRQQDKRDRHNAEVVRCVQCGDSFPRHKLDDAGVCKDCGEELNQH